MCIYVFRNSCVSVTPSPPVPPTVWMFDLANNFATDVTPIMFVSILSLNIFPSVIWLYSQFQCDLRCLYLACYLLSLYLDLLECVKRCFVVGITIKKIPHFLEIHSLSLFITWDKRSGRVREKSLEIPKRAKIKKLGFYLLKDPNNLPPFWVP